MIQKDCVGINGACVHDLPKDEELLGNRRCQNDIRGGGYSILDDPAYFKESPKIEDLSEGHCGEHECLKGGPHDDTAVGAVVD